MNKREEGRASSAVSEKYRLTLLIIFFLSGMSALIYQVVWFRFFHSVFGVTVFAVSTVLTAFMAGMAIGSLYFGRLADRKSNPLLLFGLIELGIGVYALFFPQLIRLTTDLYIALPEPFVTNFGGLTVVRFISSFLLLIIPTMLMGGTLPVLCKCLVRNVDAIGSDIGGLYSVNNLGAVLGAFLAGFILIEQIGLRSCIYVAAAVNVGIGLASLWMAWRSPIAREMDPQDKKTSTKQDSRSRTSVYPGYMIRLVLWVFAIEGFTSLAYEVLWTRILSASLMVNSVYSYTAIVITFIFGLSLGAYIAAKMVDKTKDLVTLFGYVEVGIGFSAALVLLSFSRLPSLFLWLQPDSSGSWLGIMVGEFLLAFLVMLIPTVLMGFTFPVVSKIYAASLDGFGRRIGNIGFLDIIGSVFGAFGTGFVLIGILGLHKSVLLMVLVNIVLGAVIILSNAVYVRHRKYIFAAVTTTALILIITHIPGEMRFTRTGSTASSKVSYYKEDVAGTVAVRQFSDGRRQQKVLEIDGINVAGTPVTVLTTQKMQGHFPLLLHPRAKKVLTVGYGTGGTSWSIGRHDVERIDCVEIVQALRESDRFFPETNHHSYDDPRLHLIIQDGRNYVMMSRMIYDAILNDSVHPIYQGNANLYTKEYFEFCKRRLAKDGVMASWMPVWSLSKRDLKMILKTFQSVFRHATLWFVPNNINKHLVLIAPTERLKIDFKKLQANVDKRGVKEDLAEIYMDNPYRILSCLLLDEDAVREFSKDAPLNTEDHPYLEFTAPRSWHLSQETWHDNLFELRRRRSSVLPYVDIDDVSDRERMSIERSIANYEEKTDHVLLGILASLREDMEKACSHFTQAYEMDQDDMSVNQLMVGSLHRLAVSYNDKKEYDKAVSVLREIIEITPDFAPAHCSLGFSYIQTNRPEEAIDELAKSISLEKGYGRPYYYLAVVLYSKGAKAEDVIRLLKQAVDLDPSLIPAYYNLAVLFMDQGMFSEAEDYVEQALRLDPKMKSARSLLGKIHSFRNR